MPVTASDWSRWRDVEQWVQACVSTKINRVTLFDSSKHNPTFLGNTKTPPAALSSDNKKAMTDNARHGEWLAEMERLNIPLHSTFYCFIKLLVNHAFTSFKPFHLFRISQAYIYNSALSCIIRVRKNSRLRSPWYGWTTIWYTFSDRNVSSVL